MSTTVAAVLPVSDIRAFTNSRVLTRISSPRALLTAGIALRLLTVVFLKPENVDGHSFVVSFISQTGKLPHSGDLGQAYHPPLYYLLAAPLYRLSASFKVVQLLSLVLSILILFILYRLIYHSGLIGNWSARTYSFALACFLPQFVLYTLFVSNDSLTIFLGCCTVWCAAEFIRTPGWKQIALLALVQVLGLLTKATFLAYLPVICSLIFFVWLKKAHSWAAALAVTSALALVLIAGGSYKEIDNYRQYGRPFLSNIDFHPDWAIRQQQTYQGLSSYVNFSFPRLLLSPTFSPSTESAYPLILYATFWYQHVPECNFIGSSHRPFTLLAAAIYIVGLLPSATFVIGLGIIAAGFPRLLRHFRPEDPRDCDALINCTTTALLLSNSAIMLAAVANYHVWSIMQGRLLFPSFFGILAAFSVGVDRLERTGTGTRLLRTSMAVLCILFLTYLCGEMGLQVILRFMPGAKEYLKTLVG